MTYAMAEYLPVLILFGIAIIIANWRDDPR